MTDTANSELHTPSVDDHEILMDAVRTPLGWLSFALTNKGLKASTFMYKDKEEALSVLKTGKFKGTFSVPDNYSDYNSLLQKWKDYFLGLLSGRADRAMDVPIDDSDWTDFGKKVYPYLQKLPPGGLVTYGQLAAAVGSPGASRAVGTLMKKNPIPPVVPCHRVIGSSGKLGGFSAEGGTELKKSLLKREGVNL